ncbi:LutC/YkgG family protein [Escherichia fergusonii]|uniref:LutC/YkgG family protein n=1 Tax=Escherichia fergusonii TaxID=564 RepID=UPI0029589D73|nr:LUD domain-containing protein [Escherichia fergusonii]
MLPGRTGESRRGVCRIWPDGVRRRGAVFRTGARAFLSLLPESSIFVLRKSSILPRVAQLAEKLHQKAQAGERMPSCINIISGPSSTADIELIKVVGVHGPVKAVYLIIEDC